MADTARFVDENDALRLRMRMSGAPMPYRQESPPMAQGGPVGLPLGVVDDPRDMSIASQRPTMPATPLVPPTHAGTDRPERQNFKARNPLHQGLLGKRAIGGLKWGDLLGIGLLAAHPRGAMEAVGGFLQGQQARQQREEALYENELTNWQRQQDSILDAEDRAERMREIERHNREMEALGGDRIDAGTFGRVLPLDPNAAVGLPGAPEGFAPTPGGMGTFAKNAATAENAERKTDLDVSKAFGFSASPGLPFYGQGAIPTGSIGVNNATVSLRQAQTANTDSQREYRQGPQTADTQARTANTQQDTRRDTTMLPLEVKRALANLDVLQSRIGLLGAQTERALRPPAPRGGGGGGKGGSGAAPKAPKPKAPNQTDMLKLHAKKSDMPLAMYKKWEANGGAYGPQAMESREFWIGQKVIDPKTGDISELATPEQIKRFMDDQNNWLSGRWKYGGPGVRIDTWAKPAGQPAKPKSQVQTIPVAPSRRAQMPTGMTVDAKGNIVKR